jgi:hypothetical protein
MNDQSILNIGGNAIGNQLLQASKPQTLKQRINVPTGRLINKRDKTTGSTYQTEETSPQGVFVAKYDASNNQVVVGWSAVNTLKGDYFDITQGTHIATARATTGTNKIIPNFVLNAFETKFADRCARYFKIDRSKVVLAGMHENQAVAEDATVDTSENETIKLLIKAHAPRSLRRKVAQLLGILS